MSPDKLFKRLTPLRNYLSKKLNREVIIELAQNPEQLIKRTDAGRYDMILTGPSFAVRAFDSGLYVPGVLPGGLTATVILVDSSSTITSINQLKNKTVSTPPEIGTAAKVAIRLFKENGFNNNEFPKMIPYASHTAALMAAQNGDVDAAIIAGFAYKNFIASGMPVRNIAQSKSFPGISIIFAKRLPVKLREELITTIIELNKSSEGKDVLKKIAFQPFRRASYKEFDDSRSYFSNKKKNH